MDLTLEALKGTGSPMDVALGTLLKVTVSLEAAEVVVTADFSLGILRDGACTAGVFELEVAPANQSLAADICFFEGFVSAIEKAAFPTVLAAPFESWSGSDFLVFSPTLFSMTMAVSWMPMSLIPSAMARSDCCGAKTGLAFPLEPVDPRERRDRRAGSTENK